MYIRKEFKVFFPVTSNCGIPIEKVYEFLDFHLKPIMRNGNSYIRDLSYFLERIKNIRSIPYNAMLVTTDVVRLYPSIPHSAGLNSLKKPLENRINKQIPTSDLVKITKFVLSDNYFEFSEKVAANIRSSYRRKVCLSICMYLHGRSRN